jgi:hypothetical protein
MLCGCGSRSSDRIAADDGQQLALEGMSLRVPAGWSSYAIDFGASSPEPMLWVANVTLPTIPSKDDPHELPPYQVLSHLPPNGIVLVVDAIHAEVSAEEECPSMRLRLTAADVLGSDYEGQPAPHVATGSVYSHRQGLCLFAQAWFGVNAPNEAMREQVNRVLDSVELQPDLWSSRECQDGACLANGRCRREAACGELDDEGARSPETTVLPVGRGARGPADGTEAHAR